MSLATAPKLDHATIEAELEGMSRRPFRRFLAKLLENAPSDEAIKKQAEAHPDRWGQNVAMFGRLAAYTDKLEVEGSIDLKIQGLSDSDLMRLYEETEKRLDMQSNAHSPQVLDNTESGS